MFTLTIIIAAIVILLIDATAIAAQESDCRRIDPICMVISPVIIKSDNQS